MKPARAEDSRVESKSFGNDLKVQARCSGCPFELGGAIATRAPAAGGEAGSLVAGSLIALASLFPDQQQQRLDGSGDRLGLDQ